MALLLMILLYGLQLRGLFNRRAKISLRKHPSKRKRSVVLSKRRKSGKEKMLNNSV